MTGANLLLFVILSLGVLTVGGTAFRLIYTNYSDIEAKVLGQIADYAAEIYDYLDRMFKRRPMNKIYLMILIPTLGMALFGLILGFNVGLLSGVMLAFVTGYIGYKMPGVFIRNIFMRRVAKFDRQLVDALNMMANAIKSGLSFMQVVQVIEKEMPSPCSEEFGMVLKENRVGVNLNDALLNMTKRIPSEDLFMIINSVVTLSQQGGDLSEAFETIATTIRERQRVSEKIRTLAQAGITQAVILSLLPLVMMCFLYVIQPNYVMLLFTTPLGLAMLIGMFMLMIGGALWMKKILTIEI